jgi:magnesium chelatase family protein
VVAAREAAQRRQGCANAELGPAGIRRHARLTRAARRELAAGHRRMGLSGRGHDRVLRVARTLADLRRCERVEVDDLAAALSFRRRGGE